MDATIRVAALRALAVGGEPPGAVRPAIVLRLDDSSPDVRIAAIGAAAALKLHETVPELLELAADEVYRAEATRALAELPDPRALPDYLNALGDRNPEVRRAGEAALLAIRGLVAADLESRARAGQFSGPAALAVERVLTRFLPLTEWQVIGPFPRNTPQVFADPTSIDFARPVVGAAGRTISWTARRGDPATGRVTIDDLKGSAGDRGGFGYDTNGSPDLAAFAHTEVVADRDRTALMLVGSSGTITITVNGKPTFHSANTAGRPFSPDSDMFRLVLKKGTNRILVRSRQGIGTGSFSLQLSDQADFLFAKQTGPTAEDKLGAYALSHAGDASRGEALFFDSKGIGCAKCHAAGGRGSATVGPDLTGLSLKYDKAEIVRSVLEPSNRIVSGYQPVVLAKTDGTVLTGLVRVETDTYLDLIGADLKPVHVPKSEIDARRAGEISLMPTGLVDLLSPPEFADLIAYVESLKPTDSDQPGHGR
jgi:putative heme-binding domain-containing protein